MLPYLHFPSGSALRIENPRVTGEIFACPVAMTNASEALRSALFLLHCRGRFFISFPADLHPRKVVNHNADAGVDFWRKQ